VHPVLGFGVAADQPLHRLRAELDDHVAGLDAVLGVERAAGLYRLHDDALVSRFIGQRIGGEIALGIFAGDFIDQNHGDDADFGALWLTFRF